MFQGRYGNDQLNRALMIFAVGLMVINIFVPYTSYMRNILNVAYLAVFAIAIVRMTSRDFLSRQRENAAFMRFCNKLEGVFDRVKNIFSRGAAKTVRNTPTFEERRKFKYFYCNQCYQRLRVPRKKGKLRVTCTRCGNKFDIKS